MKAFNFYKEKDMKEVDIIIDSPVQFEDAKKDYARVKIGALTVPVISIKKLIEMKNIAHIILKPGKDEFVKRYHPWIFSGAIGQVQGNPEEGDMVEVYSGKGEYLATGFYEKGSLAVKLISHKRTEAGAEFWKNKMQNSNYLDRICVWK